MNIRPAYYSIDTATGYIISNFTSNHVFLKIELYWKFDICSQQLKSYIYEKISFHQRQKLVFLESKAPIYFV